MTTLHDIADEIRACDEVYRAITDDFACFNAYFGKNAMTITEDGIKISDRMPKFAQVCSHLFEKSNLICKELIRQFNSELLSFKATLAELSETNAALKKASEIELSTTVSAMVAMTNSFDGIVAQLITLIVKGKKQADFLEAFPVMTDILEEKPLPPEKITEEFKEMYNLLTNSELSTTEKQEIKAAIKSMLALFAKICTARRCVVSAGGTFYPCANYLSQVPIRPLLDYLKIKPGDLVLASF